MNLLPIMIDRGDAGAVFSIHLHQVVSVDYLPECEGFTITDPDDPEFGEEVPRRRARVRLVTTANTSVWDDGGDYPNQAHTEQHPYTIILHDGEAVSFMNQYRRELLEAYQTRRG